MNLFRQLFIGKARTMTRLWNERRANRVELEWAEELATSYWLSRNGRTEEEQTHHISLVGEFARRLPHELVQQITANPAVQGKEEW